jgi:hypothetical protein
VASMSLGKGLRRWLRRTAAASGEQILPEYLPALPTVERLCIAARGGDRDTSPSEFALVMLAVTRDGDAAMRAAAVDALGRAEARWLRALDEALRERWWSAPRWSETLAKALADGDADLLQLVAAGCHHNGRIREAAVVYLADHTEPVAVAMLALRTCDWVPQVRDRVRANERWLSPRLGGQALAAAAEMAFALRDRREGAWLAERIERILQHLSSESLEPLLSARDRRTRRAAYRTAIAAHRLSLNRLTTAAVHDDDLPIRAMCARAAIDAAVNPAQVRVLLTSRTALVRAEALHALTAAGDTDVAETALPDRHPLVRATAQTALRRDGGDPAKLYRRLLADAPPAPGAIAGIGETGGADDAPIVVPWLSHPQPRGRVEAIRALRRLGLARPADLFPLLRDESGAVTRQVVTTLRHHTSLLDPSMLNALLESYNPPHVRFAGYRLLTGADAWQRLATNLRLLDDPDPRLRVTSRADIANWLDHDAATTYRTPDPDRAGELDRLTEQARPVLGEHKVRMLRFHAGLGSSGLSS